MLSYLYSLIVLQQMWNWPFFGAFVLKMIKNKIINRFMYYFPRQLLAHRGFSPQISEKSIKIKRKTGSQCFKQFSAVEMQDEQNSRF